MNNLIIYGNGVIAKTLYLYLKRAFNIKCFTVDRGQIREDSILGLPIFPFENIQETYSPSNNHMIIAVGYAEMNQLRRQRYIEATKKGYKIANYIHHTVEIPENVVLGEGNIVLEHCSLQPGVSLGNNNLIWSNVVLGHDSIVGNDCWIASSATMAGGSSLGSGSFLGVNSTVAENTSVGERTFIGANTSIARSTLDNEVYISGQPTRYILDSVSFLKFIER